MSEFSLRNNPEIVLRNDVPLTSEQYDRITSIVSKPIPKELIKERDGGFGKKLSYISGSTVINLLNEAFGYRWSFQVIDTRIVQSLPKQFKDKKTGNITVIEQPPYYQVLGRLTIPDLLIVKEQYGSKAILGGESEQEGAAKAAATDALKKCATLVGIGLSLYEDEVDVIEEVVVVTRDWDAKDVERLKEYKVILGIDDNVKLDPYVREFLNDKSATVNSITPLNIKGFNEFMRKKAEEV